MGKTKDILPLVIIVAVALACWQGSPATERNTAQANYSTTKSNSGNESNAANKNRAMNVKENAMGFQANLPEGFNTPTDAVGRKLLKEYGAVFVARGGAVPAKTVVFRDGSEVASFQSSVQKASDSIGGHTMELQSPAMADLKQAIADAAAKNMKITPRDTDSARRSYDETLGLWASRVDPALKHWVSKGKLTQADADRLKALSPYEQVVEVLKLEDQGLFFAKDLSKSIIYSVAPPGTSQHLSMLAFDVKEHENASVRDLLAKHKWYQTVVSDLPHFTYLGVEESELPGLGLNKVTEGGRTFWVPDI